MLFFPWPNGGIRPGRSDRSGREARSGWQPEAVGWHSSKKRATSPRHAHSPSPMDAPSPIAPPPGVPFVIGIPDAIRSPVTLPQAPSLSLVFGTKSELPFRVRPLYLLVICWIHCARTRKGAQNWSAFSRLSFLSVDAGLNPRESRRGLLYSSSGASQEGKQKKSTRSVHCTV